MSVQITIAFVMIILIGFASLGGLLFLSVKEQTLDRILFILVAFATGSILATAIFDLIPESIHHLEELLEEGVTIAEGTPFLIIMMGFISFFILERFIYWFHGHAHSHRNEDENDHENIGEEELVCHGDLIENIDGKKDKGSKKVKNFAILNLIGDGLHNFLDGVIIMVAFITSVQAGVIVTIAVLFHEFPQEIGDFGILVYGGFTKKKALLFNFLSAMIAVGGGLFAFLLSNLVETFNMFFLAFSGGGFLYIAAVELMPEILREKKLKKTVIQAIILLLGILLIYILLQVLPHE